MNAANTQQEREHIRGSIKCTTIMMLYELFTVNPWTSFGFATFVALPNVVGLTFGIVQIILYLIYRNSTPVNDEKLPEHKGDVIVNNEIETAVTLPARASTDEKKIEVNVEIEIVEKKEEKQDEQHEEKKEEEVTEEKAEVKNEKDNIDVINKSG